MNDYFNDLDKWEESFDCSECSNYEKEHFAYSRTVANGEVWTCKNCKTETVINEQPNEDNY